jgi:hypothetical protein
MDGQIVLDFYQAFLTLLVWLLASFACLGVLASVLLLYLECIPFTRPASHCLTRRRKFMIYFINRRRLPTCPN